VIIPDATHFVHLDRGEYGRRKFLDEILLHRKGQPLQFNGLWSLVFSQNKLFFTAGINDEADGLFGFIVPAPADQVTGF
jgi:hypothetical protein